MDTYIHEREGTLRTDDGLKIGDAEALEENMLASVFLRILPNPESDLRK